MVFTEKCLFKFRFLFINVALKEKAESIPVSSILTVKRFEVELSSRLFSKLSGKSMQVRLVFNRGKVATAGMMGSCPHSYRDFAFIEGY